MNKLKKTRNILIISILVIFSNIIIFNLLDTIIYFRNNSKITSVIKNKKESDEIKEELRLFIGSNLENYEMLKEDATIISIGYDVDWDNEVYYIKYILNNDPFTILEAEALYGNYNTNLTKYIKSHLNKEKQSVYISQLGYNFFYMYLGTLIGLIIIVQIIINRKQKI